MSTSENKVMAAPFKNMDIKAAFLAASNRKRKASSPVIQKNQSKNLKLCEEKDDDVIEILDEDPVITGDCKENTDLNTLQTLPVTPINGKVLPSKESKEDSKEAEHSEDEKSLSDDSESSIHSNSIELNSSALNSSFNVGELLETPENKSKSEADLNTSVDSKKNGSKSKLSDKDGNQNEARPKKKRKMTPEEAKARAEEREKSQKERLLKKQELEAKKMQKKLEREKQKQMKDQEKLEKEEKRKEQERLKQEKKDQEEKERLQKLKEKEDKKKSQEILQVMKQEEKKKKEEMRLKKEEENKKAEEEKQKSKLEKEEKKAKAKAAFMKFFKKGDANAPSTTQTVQKELAFKPFQVSDAMSLAPVVPTAAKERFDKVGLDKALKLQKCKSLYLEILRSGSYKVVQQRRRLRKPRNSDAEVIVLDKTEQAEVFLTAKLLQFTENVRPPYWGTWRKHSKKVGPRNPFGQDEVFDYAVDSEEEWDEGGPGESLSGTDNEVESEDDYEVDNEFFVPHGYLSAEEEMEEDEAENDPEKQKATLKQKQQEFERERKKKTMELKPVILGCYFENSSGPKDSGLATFLLAYRAEILLDSPIPTCFTIKKLQSEAKPVSTSTSPNVVSKKVPEKAMTHLIRLLHGNSKGKDTIAKEFQTFWQQHISNKAHSSTASPENPQLSSLENPSNADANSVPSVKISKRQLILTINKISTYGKCPNPTIKKNCWWVNDEVREKYELYDLLLPSSTAKEEVEVVPVVKDSASIKEFFKNGGDQGIQEQ